MIFQKNIELKIDKGFCFILLLSSLLIVFACNHKLEFGNNPDIESNVSERYASVLKWIKTDSIKDSFAYKGESNVVRKVFSVDSILLSKEEISDVIIYEDGEKCIIRFLPFPGKGTLDYIIKEPFYSIRIEYWDQSVDIKGRAVKVKFNQSILTFKNDSFQDGDTVLGYLKLRTKPYFRNNKVQYDTYEGYFTSIVFPIDSIVKYPIKLIVRLDNIKKADLSTYASFCFRSFVRI